MFDFAMSEYVTYQMVQVFMQVGDFFFGRSGANHINFMINN